MKKLLTLRISESNPVGILESAHESNVWCLDWHPLGHLLVSSSNDHATRFWTRHRPEDTMDDQYIVGSAEALQQQMFERQQQQAQMGDREERDRYAPVSRQGPSALGGIGALPMGGGVPGIPGLQDGAVGQITMDWSEQPRSQQQHQSPRQHHDQKPYRQDHRDRRDHRGGPSGRSSHPPHQRPPPHHHHRPPPPHDRSSSPGQQGYFPPGMGPPPPGMPPFAGGMPPPGYPSMPMMPPGSYFPPNHGMPPRPPPDYQNRRHGRH